MYRIQAQHSIQQSLDNRTKAVRFTFARYVAEKGFDTYGYDISHQL